ncbi:hypothetical protein ABBQ32_008964 [Trebouxia sp. C0010 RCD-2024]
MCFQADESKLSQECSPAGWIEVQGASPNSPSPTATTITLADLGCWSPAEQPTPTTVTASKFSDGPSDRAPYTGKGPYMPSPLGPAVTTDSGFQVCPMHPLPCYLTASLVLECAIHGTRRTANFGSISIRVFVVCWVNAGAPPNLFLRCIAGSCKHDS